ncbi:MAG: hypothetical protein IEMM0008_1913 [bacterium]|nr:MAG: hypothetical protein IEMM0008_1913 [bacterium]
MKIMTYKGFEGSIKYDEEYKEYYGRILNMRDYVDYIAAKDLNELERYFQEAVNDYILYCKGKEEKLEKSSDPRDTTY